MSCCFATTNFTRIGSYFSGWDLCPTLIYVVPNEENLAFDEYIKQEKEALLELREAFGVESSLPRTEAPIAVDGQKGVLLQGYSWDHIIRMYVPFPDSSMLLVIGKTETSEGSFDAFDQILSSFRFVRQ